MDFEWPRSTKYNYQARRAIKELIMSGVLCPNVMVCGRSTNDATLPKCERPDCPGAKPVTFAPFKPGQQAPRE